MRTMFKGPDGKWVTEAAPETAEELLKWLYKQDGKEAVVADDQKEIYYCGNESMLQFYHSKGKAAEMFIVLRNRLQTSVEGTN